MKKLLVIIMVLMAASVVFADVSVTLKNITEPSAEVIYTVKNDKEVFMGNLKPGQEIILKLKCTTYDIEIENLKSGVIKKSEFKPCND